MLSRSVQVVTFNDNERHAVTFFLNELVSHGHSKWKMNGRPGEVVRSNPKLLIQHVHLSAQGNTIAAREVAKFYRNAEAHDFVIFYGCAGALSPSDVGSAFLVSGANYVSLGTVQLANSQESVTIKSKWIVDTTSSNKPLEALTLPLATRNRMLNMSDQTRIPTAHVIATDKVIRIGPTSAPQPLSSLPPHAEYAPSEWTYGEALAYFAASHQGTLLIEMESYGICAIAEALGIADRTLILRVATDDLVNHAKSDEKQFNLLSNGRAVLARLVLALLFPGVKVP